MRTGDERGGIGGEINISEWGERAMEREGEEVRGGERNRTKRELRNMYF